MIPVTKAFLPPIDDHQAKLPQIWKSGWLTNDDPVMFHGTKERNIREADIFSIFFKHIGPPDHQIFQANRA
jgi:hypothetical protein